MANFWADICSALKYNLESTLDVEKIYISDWQESWNQEDSRVIALKPFFDKSHNIADVAVVLNFQYNDGYGSQDCPDVNIWTKNYIYYIHEYDGSTCFHSVPRNPI